MIKPKPLTFDLREFINDVFTFDIATKLEEKFDGDDLVLYIREAKKNKKEIAQEISDIIFPFILKHLKTG